MLSLLLLLLLFLLFVMFFSFAVIKNKVTLSLIEGKILGYFRNTIDSYVEILVEVMTDRNELIIGVKM